MHNRDAHIPPMAVLGSGLCIPDDSLANSLGLKESELELSVLPPMTRRRTSLATRIAISAATRACANADVERDIPAVFVSVLGEMQVTDRLCQAIAKQQYPLSPTMFHNSVHNTAAGYWSMAVGSTAPMQAMGGMDDSLALGLLEAWCQLQTITDKVLLVCYDEEMPQRVLYDYQWKACAVSLVLSSETSSNPLLSRPYQSDGIDVITKTEEFAERSPAMAGLQLVKLLKNEPDKGQQMQLSGGTTPWFVDLLISRSCEYL